MGTAEELLRDYVDATSAADGEKAAALSADDLVIELPDGTTLEGKEGARQFAAKHGEIDGRKQSVRLTALEARGQDRFVATLELSSREITSDEVLYSMGVGSVFEVRDGLVARNRVFPSPDEAAAAAG